MNVITRIVVAVDFSPESRRAVDHAMAVARHVGAALTLVHVETVPPAIGVGPQAELPFLRGVLEDDRRQLAELRERLSGQGVEVSHVVATGYPDTAIADAARELHGELVVVGTRGRTGIKRILLGSVAERTIRHADCSVLVTRGDAVAGGYRRVVVGTDYSELAWRAVARAFALVAPGGDVHVIHAWSASYSDFALDGGVLAGLRDAAETAAVAERARLVAMARPPGVTVRLDVVDGAPFQALDQMSSDADLLVVGSHGRRGVRRLLVGSVAETTTRHARCSVLVAR